MTKRQDTNWMTAGFGMMMLAIESQQVIALRMAKMALGGPAAMKEAQTMVAEKIDAAMEIQRLALDPDQAQRFYRRKVRANRKRLLG